MPQDTPDWSPSRGQYFDRNAGAVTNLSAQNTIITPAGDTILQNYTVPTARAALWSHVNLWIHRRTAAAPVGEIYLHALAFAATYDLRTYNNTVDTFDKATHSSLDFLKAGQAASVRYHDLGTGGNNDYYYNVALVEYDA